MKNLLSVFLLFLVAIMSFAQKASYHYAIPDALNDGWATSTLYSKQVDSTLVYKFFNQLAEGNHQLHSVLLLKDGELILEEYFAGYTAQTPHDLRSTSKSIRSLLLGIAIDKGFIASVNDPISKYLKSPVPQKNLDKRKENISIQHLLTMSTGLECNDWNKKSKGQEDKVYKKKDWLQYTLDLPMVNAPGEVAHYCSMGAIIAAEIISQASGMPIDQFAQEHLFDPLGIENVKWGHTSEKEVIAPGKRLYMTPRDMAKIGQLVLNKGKWNGRQLVSEAWVEEATTPKTKITGIDYGYLWWNIPFPLGEEVIISKTATGNGGQYIMVFPDLNVVGVFTGGAYNSQEDKLAFAIMKDVFLASMKGEK